MKSNPKNPKVTRYTFRCLQSLMSKLRKQAKQKERSTSWLVNRYLDECAQRQEAASK